MGTSAPLLTNPSLTDLPISIPQLPNDTSNLQDTEARNTRLPSTNEQAARNNLSSTRGRGRWRAVLSRSTRATKSQSHHMRLRAQRTPVRRGRPRGRPPRQPRGHTTVSSRQTAPEIDTQPSITSDSIQMRPPRSLHPILTKVRRKSTRAMVYGGVRYLDIVVKTAGSVIAFASCL